MFRRLACSFCGRRAADVSKLVAGPRAYICDRCIEAASEIIRQSNADGSQAAPRQGFWRRMMSRLAHARLLGRHWLLSRRHA
jgi:ATP-dependent Clp protease ATP-binding subunit ClpX